MSTARRECERSKTSSHSGENKKFEYVRRYRIAITDAGAFPWRRREGMSAWGQQWISRRILPIVRFSPESGHRETLLGCPVCANGRPSAPQHNSCYSITSSVPTSRFYGSVTPRALAVFRFIANSNFVGCSTGRSAGLAPLRILATKSAVRRCITI